MSQTLTYRQMGPAARDQAHTLFAQTMGYVAITDINEAPLLAASIFLDVLNVFLFFLQIFSGEER
jgi:hypothetical protein